MNLARTRTLLRNSTHGRKVLFAGCALSALSAFAGCTEAADEPPGRNNVPIPADAASAAADPVPAGLPGAQLAARTGMRRLTTNEYTRTVALLLEDDIDTSTLPQEGRTPFDNDEATQATSPAFIVPLELLAEGIAKKFVADVARRDRIVGCTPEGPTDEACLRSFVARFGRLAMRRPLEPAEITTYLGLTSLAKDQNDFYAAVEVFLAAMLQHPEFIYRVEVGTPAQAGLARMTNYEMASRLSFLFLGRGPDDALLDLAASGKLDTVQGVRDAATALFAKPETRDQLQRFFQLWMGYEKLPHDKALSDAMRAESDALVAKVVFTEDRPFQDLFRASETFLSPMLATHYELPSPGAKSGWVPYGASGRRGILSQGSLLSAGASFGDTSPTQRGKWVRTRLMCQTTPPPPPDSIVDEPPGKDTPNACKLHRYKALATGSCKGCHAVTDPIGFGLERYDDKGRFRETEPNRPDCPIDGQGEVTGVGTFRDPSGLSDVLLKAGALHDCSIVQMERFVHGHTDLDANDEASAKVLGDLRPGDFKMRDLLLDIVSAEAFLHRNLPL